LLEALLLEAPAELDDGDEDEDEAEPEEAESEGVALVPVAVVTVADEAAGQPRRRSELSWERASNRAVSSALTDAWALASVEALSGVASASASARAFSSALTLSSSARTLDRSAPSVVAETPLGIVTL
jgi:hypothetical protein